MLYNKPMKITSSGFMEKDKLTEMLKNNFSSFSLEEEIFQEKYDSILQFLDSIKYTGTRGSGIGGGSLWTPQKIKKLEQIYKEKFGSFISTYQVFYCMGGK
jgi:hypothetical protein